MEEKEIIKRAVEAIIQNDGKLAEELFLEAYKLGSGCAAYNLSSLYKMSTPGVDLSQDYQYWLDESVRLGFKPTPSDPKKFKDQKYNLSTSPTRKNSECSQQEEVKDKKGWLRKVCSFFNEPQT